MQFIFKANQCCEYFDNVVKIKQSHSTPGIMSEKIYFREYGIYNIIVNVVTNGKKVFLWNNITKNQRHYLKDGINIIKFNVQQKYANFGILVTNPVYNSVFTVLEFRVEQEKSKQKKILFNDIFKNVYIMNLDRRTDRMDKMKLLMKNHNIQYTRISAIDGKNLEIPKGSKLTSKGAYGNLLTNIKILEDAKKRKYSEIVIFEDDILFHKNFDTMLSKITNVPQDWDILYLGSSQRIGTINLIPKQTDYYIANQSRGTFAYVIKSHMYDILLNLYKTYEENVDMLMGRIQEKYRCYVIWENLVIADISNSDIQQPRNMSTICPKFGWNLEAYNTGNVTIIMPVYNGANYLQEAIDSILAQDYIYFNLIIVNDGSKDKTKEILAKIKDSRVRIITNSCNYGISYSLNMALSQTATKYVTWTSHDNIYSKTAINKMVTYLDNNNVNLVTAGHECFGDIHKQVFPTKYTKYDIFFNFHGIACFLFKTELINKIGLYDVSLPGVEDWDYMIRILNVSPYTNGTINEILYRYRIHNKQTSKSINIKDLTFKLCEKIVSNDVDLLFDDVFLLNCKYTSNDHIKEFFQAFVK